LIELLKTGNDYVRLDAAKTIIERVMGKVPQRLDVPADTQTALIILKMDVDEL